MRCHCLTPDVQSAIGVPAHFGYQRNVVLGKPKCRQQTGDGVRPNCG